MPFTIYCDNRGCMKDQQPLLDPDTNDVMCAECDRPIKNVTDFTRRQLKAIGQIKRGQVKEAFAVKCEACKKEARPQLESDNLLCRFCKKKLTGLSKPFELIVKNALKTGKAEV